MLRRYGGTRSLSTIMFSASTSIRGKATHVPECHYPSAAETSQHGVQPLLDEVPTMRMDLCEAAKLDAKYRIVPLRELSMQKQLEAAHVVAAAFAVREPMTRHLRLPSEPLFPLDSNYTDAYGSVTNIGPWTVEKQMYWFIRSFVLTDCSSPQPASVNADTMHLSMALMEEEEVAAAWLVDIMRPTTPNPRENCPVIGNVLGGQMNVIFDLLMGQDERAMKALCDKYHDFQTALEAARVAHAFMLGKRDSVSGEQTRAFLWRSFLRFRDEFDYACSECTNNATGAMREALGFMRVDFASFRVQEVVPKTHHAIIGKCSSSDGFISNKDSGSMFYLAKVPKKN